MTFQPIVMVCSTFFTPVVQSLTRKELKTQLDDIARHFQFGPTPYGYRGFDTQKIHLLNDSETVKELCKYLLTVETIRTEYDNDGVTSPVMLSLMDETVSLIYTTLKMMQELEACHQDTCTGIKCTTL